MHHWMNMGSVFCMLCGELKENLTALITHLSMKHKIRCGQCRAIFASEDHLSTHMLLHDCRTGSELDKHNLKGGESENLNNEECKVRVKVQTNVSTPTTFKKKFCDKNYVRQFLADDTQSELSFFRCDMCLMEFSRRFDLKKHKIKYHSHSDGKLLDKENSGYVSVNVVEYNNKSCLSSNESKQSFVGGLNSVDEDENDSIYSDCSVNSEDISRHLDIQAYNSQEQTNSCSVCGLVFANKREMCTHRRKEHSLQEQKPSLKKSVSKISFTCSLCNNSYSRSSDLQRHIMKKHGGEKFVSRCVDSVDDMSIEIINRAKLDINGTIVYQCDICEKNMLTKRGFVRHVRIHNDERPFTCHMCGRQYRSHPDLRRHLRSVHDRVKNYPCDICSRSFANKGTRDDHRRTHTGERPYICHTCGKAFPTSNSIYVHRRTHSDYFPHHCTTCNKKFRRRQQLTHHLRTHTGEKPHSCDICGKRFGVKDEVSRHRLTHSNEKPHLCLVCGICFGQKRYLTNHMKTHHAGLL